MWQLQEHKCLLRVYEMRDRRGGNPDSSFFEGCRAGKLNFFLAETMPGEDPCSCLVPGYSLSGEVGHPQLHHSDNRVVNYGLIKCLCLPG